MPLGISEGYLDSNLYKEELEARKIAREEINKLEGINDVELNKPPLDKQIENKASYEELEAALRQGVNAI